MRERSRLARLQQLRGQRRGYTADRHGQGVDVRIEGRLVSSFRKKTEGFVIADAFFLDLTMGVLPANNFTTTTVRRAASAWLPQ